MIAALTVAKAVFQRLWWSTPFLLVALGLLWWSLTSAQTKVDKLTAWAGQVLAETQDAALNPKLVAQDVPAQIKALGSSVSELRGGLAVAKASALAAAKNDANRRDALQQQMAVLNAQDRGRQSVIERLAASATRPAQNAKCEVSPTLKELWK